MTKEEIIKGWINKSEYIKNVINSDKFKGDKDNPPFFLVYIDAHNKDDIADLCDIAFPVRAHYKFDLQTGKLEELDETVKYPFIEVHQTENWINSMLNHLYEAPNANYFKDGDSIVLTDTAILAQKKIIAPNISWMDLVYVRMKAPLPNEETKEFDSFDKCKVYFGLYRIYNDFGSVAENFNLGCSETYDKFIEIKESLKEELEEELFYNTIISDGRRKAQFNDFGIVSLRDMYLNIQEWYKKIFI